jgi:hypothetical protein
MNRHETDGSAVTHPVDTGAASRIPVDRGEARRPFDASLGPRPGQRKLDGMTEALKQHVALNVTVCYTS